MPRRAYALYVRTFHEARHALESGDEARLRTLCVEVAGRGGVESTVSLMALSDAEHRTASRPRSQIMGVYWRGVARAHVGSSRPCEAAPRAA